MSTLTDRLKSIAEQLAPLVDDLTREVTEYRIKDHIELIRYFDEFRKSADIFDETKKALTELRDNMSREYIPDAMFNAGVKTVNVVGVGRVTVSQRFSCSMLDKEAGIDWLKHHGLGGIVIETVNSSTLAATAKKMIQEEGKDLPENIFKISAVPYTSITKVA